MTAPRKRASSRATTRTTRRTTARTTRRTTGRRTTGTVRRRRPTLPTTLGTAVGMLVVTALLDASWPVRIGLVALVLVVGLGIVLWTRRADLAAAGQSSAPATDSSGAGSDVTDPSTPATGSAPGTDDQPSG